MRIRSYVPSDAPALGEIFVASVREIGSRDYSPEQVAVWGGEGQHAARAVGERLGVKMADGRRCWVAVDDADAPVAFVDLEADGHIDLLYAAPEAVGTGAAGLLLDALEAAAREAGMTRLYVEASEAARRFFLKCGFAVDHRRDFEVDGVPIHNYAMSRTL
ncbi:MAG: GNAT family N-acetyltransferase [Caulobacteraceae bacterium]|nr:GNAT family N-acetyltransferase [Caulobacteraceae bacterium]